MSHIIKIEVKKRRTAQRFFFEQNGKSMEVTIDEVLELIDKHNLSIVKVETYEEGRLLLSGYLRYNNKSNFKKRLQKAAKAQI